MFDISISNFLEKTIARRVVLCQVIIYKKWIPAALNY